MNIPNIQQSAEITNLKNEIAFLKGQVESAFALASFIVMEHFEGEVVVPKDFGAKLKDRVFDLEPTTDSYILRVATPTPTPNDLH